MTTVEVMNNQPPRTEVLYLSYDGVLEPLGDSQVVSYLSRLAADFELTLLSFEKPADLADGGRVAAMSDRLARLGIRWVRRQYHKRPPVLSTAWDVIAAIRQARAICRARRVRVVHARSYVPSLIALGARGASGARFLFDMRGFWVDEKVEAGHWPKGGALERVGKFWERRFFAAADGIVSLTQAGVDAFPAIGYQVRPTMPVAVIPTCVDLERFVPREKDPALLKTLGLEGALVIGSTGTVSNWYLRTEMLAYLTLAARRLPQARILMVTREDHAALRRDAAAAGLPADRLVLTQAPFAEMPRYTSLFDAGIFFIRPTHSKRGSAATKLAEFLACGVPVVINAGVGDSGTIVEQHRAGIVVPSLDAVAQAASLDALVRAVSDTGMRARCRQAAETLFDVDQGARRYAEMYRSLVKG